MSYVIVQELRNWLAKYPDDAEIGLTSDDELCIIQEDSIVDRFNVFESSREEDPSKTS